MVNKKFNPIESMADARHEFGEHGGVNLSIEASTTFTVLAADEMPKIFRGERGPFSMRAGTATGGCYLYGRNFNPTVYTFGRMLAAMEGTEAGYATASGMGAIASVLTQLCDQGDKIVASRTIYGGTFALLKDYFPLKTGVLTEFVSITDHAAVRHALQRTNAKVLYTETIANPTMEVADIGGLAEIAHSHGAVLVVDNTFAPMLVSPAQLGADIVIHSVTKFISGASDVIAGAICGSEEFIYSLMDLHNGSLMLLGPTMDPKIAHELTLRLPHLGLRMREHSARAMDLATRLRACGATVMYPGLPDHPQHKLLSKMLNEGFGYGGLLTVDLGTIDRANRFMERLQNQHSFGFMAVSLGYFETLMSCSGSSTSSELTEDEQRVAGISPGLVRISVGLTGSIEQRWEQLSDTLAYIDT
ncbi:MAG TPA: aminotransferase class I/II-fold pyridoxal phosphate-dependent enzyme [Pirellulaceae bacterium]|nr:aminotransferase class I/II-fold pyridoxal phosphate-dependent enzyme [Pirellulaceae bacterium]HMO93995.1 aminotransferase class I/II-fold pyridoxal phosphate-dependent enzyme [Pirellulaceae bacterium]HMP70867.1 aminotransferase class I/II-fold pyridoxal phosphate-dependent enzyme [Pirellulaceae bacterium]